jgi:phosphoribosylformylglycinamidine synthase
VLRIPVAHGDGRFTASADVLEKLEGDGHVVFRYVTPEGQPDASANPNGSQNNIAGIVNAAGNVMGMMPHPERAADPLNGCTDGLAVFTSIALSQRRA